MPIQVRNRFSSTYQPTVRKGPTRRKCSTRGKSVPYRPREAKKISRPNVNSLPCSRGKIISLSRADLSVAGASRGCYRLSARKTSTRVPGQPCLRKIHVGKTALYFCRGLTNIRANLDREPFSRLRLSQPMAIPV